MKKSTNEDLDKWLIDNNKTFHRIDNVKTCRDKIEFECDIDVCRYRWKSEPRSIKEGRGCPKCAGNIKLNNEDFDKWLSNNSKTFHRIGNISNCRTKTEFKCDVSGCEYIWSTFPLTIKNKGAGCPRCSRTEKITNENFDILFSDGKKTFHRIEDVINGGTPIWFECDVDGYRWKTTPSHIKSNNTGCPRCSYNKKRSKNEELCFELLKKMYPYLRFESNDLEILKGKGPNECNLEIDIRIQDEYYQNILYIEWNGVHWHKRHYKKNNDELKKKLLGDKLIQIIDDTHGFNKEFVESVIYEQIVPRLGTPSGLSEDFSEYFK